MIYEIKNIIAYFKLSKDERYWAKNVYHWSYLQHLKNKKLGNKLIKDGRIRNISTCSWTEDGSSWITAKKHSIIHNSSGVNLYLLTGLDDSASKHSPNKEITENFNKEIIANIKKDIQERV